MANTFDFVPFTGGFTVKLGTDDGIDYPAGFWKVETPTANTLEIRNVETNAILHTLVVGTDTIKISGSTNAGNATAIKTALQAVFFKGNSSSAGSGFTAATVSEINTGTDNAKGVTALGLAGSALAGTVATHTTAIANNTANILAGAVIPATALLAEYRFDEGTGTVLTDYSGNGNNGAYVGSPTRVANGGFLGADTKYATGAAAFLATAQTFYFVVDVDPDSAAIYHPIMGNSGGRLNVGVYATPVSTGAPFHGAHLMANNASAFTSPSDTAPFKAYIIAITFSGTDAVAPKIYINGKEVLNYVTRTYAGIAVKRTGTPWFGQDAGGSAYYAANFYYAASYSALHDDATVAGVTDIIKRKMIARGVPLTTPYNATTTVNQLLGDGDSLTDGSGANSYINQITTTETFTKWKKGWPGLSASGSLAAGFGFSELHFAPMATNIVVVWVGANGPYVVATVMSNIRAKCIEYKRRGWKVIVCTLIDRGDAQGTTVPAAAFFAAISPAIRANYKRYADELADLNADTNLGTVGASNNTTNFQGDKVHLTTAGQAIAAGIIGPAINRITDANPV